MLRPRFSQGSFRDGAPFELGPPQEVLHVGVPAVKVVRHLLALPLFLLPTKYSKTPFETKAATSELPQYNGREKKEWWRKKVTHYFHSRNPT